ncbi:MAG: hypothetical protein KBF95_02130 [Dysgonomonadaceae bacterium]|jgi:hypothetical protein|nr:hypothetical protein [Dysgonamonadaceae bacterium]HOV36586.1 hypothetical protein [Dysgonamonadaceae bacterium]HQG08683.1 hypothetical protein [Dysgonamonadaceae bacterium]
MKFTKKNYLLVPNVFILACLLFILIIGYLFAVNGRYIVISDGHVYDKWKKEVYRIGSKEIPVIVNGEDIYDVTR